MTSKDLTIAFRPLTLEESKGQCRRMLYVQASRYLPGLEPTDIGEFNPLEDGTILFGVHDSRVSMADVQMPNPHSIRCGVYKAVGEVPIRIEVPNVWVWMALREDGVIITNETCLDGLVRQLILRDLAKWMEERCGTC
jgi:hypothetical protein